MRACAVGLCLWWLSAPGCFFDTRDPESGDVEICFETVVASQFDTVFVNMDGSLECKQSSDYLDQLAADFEYIPAPGVANLPADWGKDEESNFVDRLFADADEIDARLRLRDVVPPSGTTEVIVEAEYTMTVVTSGSSTTYTGEAFYTLAQVASTWVMTKWEEKSSGNPLAVLRAGLVGGG